MDLFAKARFQSDLSIKLVNAIRDQREWGDVLDCIIEGTGAKAVAITLRAQDSCQMVTDVELEKQYHSPLFRGFTEDGLKYYLAHLPTKDLWADFQKLHYPHLPTRMSEVCPYDSIRGTLFQKWLSSEGFEDTILFELDRMAGYWTAINLFVEKVDGKDSEQLIEFANEAYDLLRESWKASQAMVHQKQSVVALLDQASDDGTPVCLASANGEMIECNALFRDLIAMDAVRLRDSAQKISFAQSIAVQGLLQWEQNDLLRHGADTDPVLLVATPVDPDPLFPDKREQFWLLKGSKRSLT